MRRAFAIAALVLAACGGVPDTAPQAPLAPDLITVQPVQALTPPATLLAGLYKGTLDNASSEFLALVVPEADKNVHVYGWYYNANDSHVAHLYAGQLKLGIEGNAANVPQSWLITEGTQSYPAIVNVSASSLSKLSASLSVSRSSFSSYTLTANALPNNVYDFNSPPPDMRNSVWMGYWSSGADTTAGPLQFGANGMPNASGSSWLCLAGSAPLTWTWTAQSTNTFKVGLVLGPNTYCTNWQNRQLAGLATVSKQNGVDQLDMMLLDGKGAGISYRGTR
jgi:hypothetical protein